MEAIRSCINNDNILKSTIDIHEFTMNHCAVMSKIQFVFLDFVQCNQINEYSMNHHVSSIMSDFSMISIFGRSTGPPR